MLTLKIADEDDAIRLDPTLIFAYANRGRAYASKHDYSRTLSDLDQTVRLNPQHGVAYYLRGVIYEFMNDYSHAIADYERSSKLDPSLSDARGRLQAVVAKSPRPARRRGAGWCHPPIGEHR